MSRLVQLILHLLDLKFFLQEFFIVERRVIDLLVWLSNIGTQPFSSVTPGFALFERLQIVDECLLVFFELIFLELALPDSLPLLCHHEGRLFFSVLLDELSIVDFPLQL